MLSTGFTTALQTEEGRKRMDDRIEDRDTGNMEAATANLERAAQFFLNNGEQNDTRIFFNIAKYLVDLSLGTNERPMVFDGLYSLELNKTGAGNTMHRLASCVRDQMKMKGLRRCSG